MGRSLSKIKMVTEKDLIEDYIEVIKSGELEKKRSPRITPALRIALWAIIFALIFWSVGMFY